MTVSKTTKPGKERTIEEAVSYAVGHRIRIEVLAALNEGSRSPNELAKLVGQPLSKVTHHIHELVESRSIELARTAQVRNTVQHFYRAVEVPFFSDEEMASMAQRERQEIYGLILQASMAEALAAFWAGKITNDPRVWLSWRWFNVDAQGRSDIADEQAKSWARIQEIESESSTRRADSGEEAVSVIVTSQGYERSRTSPTPPATTGKTE
jgi:DNA-binding transcriptional ArsR family regulator